MCCRPWDHKQLDTIEQLNKNNKPLEPAASFCRASGFSRVDWTPFWRLTSYLNPHVLCYMGSPELLFWISTKKKNPPKMNFLPHGRSLWCFSETLRYPGFFFLCLPTLGSMWVTKWESDRQGFTSDPPTHSPWA